MIYCTNCGTALPETAKFCNVCGTAVKTAPVSKPAPEEIEKEKNPTMDEVQVPVITNDTFKEPEKEETYETMETAEPTTETAPEPQKIDLEKEEAVAAASVNVAPTPIINDNISVSDDKLMQSQQTFGEQQVTSSGYTPNQNPDFSSQPINNSFILNQGNYDSQPKNQPVYSGQGQYQQQDPQPNSFAQNNSQQFANQNIPQNNIPNQMPNQNFNNIPNIPGTPEPGKSTSSIVPIILIIAIIAVILFDVFFLFKKNIFGAKILTDTYQITTTLTE